MRVRVRSGFRVRSGVRVSKDGLESEEVLESEEGLESKEGLESEEGPESEEGLESKVGRVRVARGLVAGCDRSAELPTSPASKGASKARPSDARVQATRLHHNHHSNALISPNSLLTVSIATTRLGDSPPLL